MESNELLKLIMGYKRSSALIAAYCSGLLNLLNDNCLDIQAIATETGMNTEQLYVFLLYLNYINIVEEDDGKWHLSKKLADSYIRLQNLADVIYHEKNIFSKWMTPGQIENSLKVKVGERAFDHFGFSEEEQRQYDKAMNGNNLRIIGLQICQEVRGLKLPSVLEYGRSQDYVSQALKKSGYQFNGYYMVDESVCRKVQKNRNSECIKLVESNCIRKFNFIMLYNTIHYYSKDIFLKKMSLLKQFLSEDGFIFIIDLFYKKDDSFSSEILLDWLTHGGTSFFTVESLIDELEISDYQLTRSVEIQKISTTILMIRKK